MKVKKGSIREVLEEIEEKLLLAGNISGGDNIDIIEGIISQLKQKYLKDKK